MKFCRNCGNQLADNVQFCSNCGTPIATPVAAQPNEASAAPVAQPYVASEAPVVQPYTPSEPFTQPYVAPAYALPVKSNNSKIGMIAFGIIVILICILSYLLVFKNIFAGTYKTPIKNMVSAIEKQNLKKLFKSFPDYQVKEIKETIEYYYDGDDSIFWEEFSEYGDFDMDYSIEDKDKLDKDELDTIEEDIEYYYDEKVKITAGYEVEVELILEYDGDEESETSTMTVVKLDGKWVIYEGGSIF